jgi:hypothetical protein
MLSCPDGTLQELLMGLAFDNFDKMTQTLSGSGSLHVTMGILYQNVPGEGEQTKAVEVIENTTSNPLKGKRKKQSLDIEQLPLLPYRKKPRMSVFRYTNTEVFNLPDVSTPARNLNFIWMEPCIRCRHADAADVGRLQCQILLLRQIAQTGDLLHAKPEPAHHQSRCTARDTPDHPKMCQRMWTEIWHCQL